MAKALYDSVNGVARKVTKLYDGVGGVARKVTKAYDGVDGVARQYFSSDITYSGIKSVEIISQNYHNVMTPDPSWGAYCDSYWRATSHLIIALGINHAACTDGDTPISQGVYVEIGVESDSNGTITGFSNVYGSVEPFYSDYGEYDCTMVTFPNENTAFVDGYLDVKMTCTSAPMCVEATARITFE